MQKGNSNFLLHNYDSNFISYKHHLLCAVPHAGIAKAMGLFHAPPFFIKTKDLRIPR